MPRVLVKTCTETELLIQLVELPGAKKSLVAQQSTKSIKKRVLCYDKKYTKDEFLKPLIKATIEKNALKLVTFVIK